MNNVIPLHRTQDSYEIVVLDAADTSDPGMQAVQALRENKAVIVKLEALDKRQAQRLLDFVSGSAYAIAGNPIKLGRMVFLFTPSSIKIQARLSD